MQVPNSCCSPDFCTFLYREWCPDSAVPSTIPLLDGAMLAARTVSARFTDKKKIPCESMLRLRPKNLLHHLFHRLQPAPNPSMLDFTVLEKILRPEYLCLWACLSLQTWRRQRGGSLWNWEMWLCFCCCCASRLLTQEAEQEGGCGRYVRTGWCWPGVGHAALPAQTRPAPSPKPQSPRATWQLELLETVWATALGMLRSRGISTH